MKLEVFLDYACPFCLRGYGYLEEILPEFPALTVEWRPCEAHPRPDAYGLHSDLCARGMYIAGEQGADLLAYHRQMYRAQTEGLNIEDVQVVAGLVEGLVDPGAFRRALLSGAYMDKLEGNNRAAWDEYRFSAVPSLVLDGRRLTAVPEVGLTPEGIRQFLAQARA